MYREYAPSAGLEGVVDAFWRLSAGRSGEKRASTILPDGSVEIVLSVGAPVRPSSRSARDLIRFVVGQLERPARLYYFGRVDLVGIRLAPWAITSVLGCAASGLAGRTRTLADVAPRLDRDLDRAIRVRSRPARQAAIERALHGALARHAAPDPIVRSAATMIRVARGSVRLAAIARALGLTLRQFERRFHREVGISPKRWCRVVRFQGVLAATGSTIPHGWADLAGELGYADQSHLTREFSEFVGVPPTGRWWRR